MKFEKEVVEAYNELQNPKFFEEHWSHKESFFAHQVFRYNVTFKAIKKYAKKNATMLDLGTYPGLFQQFLDKALPLKISFSGLGFSKEFKKVYKKFPCYDIDFEKKEYNKKIKGSFDTVTCMNIIEHLDYPNRLLDSANFYMKKGGYIFLTTDNASNFFSITKILRGGSAFEHLTQSKIFFTGDWKPHVRYYSKEDLQFLLTYSGFEIVDHEFFDHRNHEYLDNLKRKKSSIKKILVETFLQPLFPYIKDHHMIVAKKVVEFDKLDSLRPQPTDNMVEWLKIRKEWKDYKIFRGLR